MRIAINCRSILLNQRTGIGRYTYHLLDHLGKIDQTNEYILHAPKRLFDLKRQTVGFCHKGVIASTAPMFEDVYGHLEVRQFRF